MVTLFVRDGTLYRFPSVAVAEYWMELHPEKYGFNKDNVDMFCDHSQESTVELSTVLYIRQCPACEAIVKYTKEPKERINLKCPNCSSHIDTI